MRSSRGFNSDNIRGDRADAEDGETQTMYKSPNLNNISDSGETTLISDQVRVYKGGSWKDRAYWLDLPKEDFIIRTKQLILLDLDV